MGCRIKHMADRVLQSQTTLMCTIQKWDKTSTVYLPPDKHVPQTVVVWMKHNSPLGMFHPWF